MEACCFPSERRSAFYRLHGSISQNIEFFVAIIVVGGGEAGVVVVVVALVVVII
jgi:hypothetical protein